MDVESVLAQLQSGQIAEGAATSAFEGALAARYGFREAIAVGSGSQALRLALKALALPAEARVALPTFVCPDVAGAVESIGAQLVVCDVSEDALLDAGEAAEANAHAIIVPAMFGRQADVHRYTGAPLIADWAQYAPASPGDSRDGYEIAIVSFEATKLLSTGEGGAVLVRDTVLAARVRALKLLRGNTHRLNLYPLSALQAALGLSQLAQLNDFLERRGEIARSYASTMPNESAGLNATNPFRYVVRVEGDRIAALIDAFARRGIAARRPVDPMIHQLRPQARAFPMAERLFRENFSLPCHPSLSDAEVKTVADAMRELLS